MGLENLLRAKPMLMGPLEAVIVASKPQASQKCILCQAIHHSITSVFHSVNPDSRSSASTELASELPFLFMSPDRPQLPKSSNEQKQKYKPQAGPPSKTQVGQAPFAPSSHSHHSCIIQSSSNPRAPVSIS